MTRIYLDSNIISYLHHPEDYAEASWQKVVVDIQEYLEQAIETEVVYSPAHLMDVRKGYLKDQQRAIEKLRFIGHITRNRRIAKYLEGGEVLVQVVDPEEFFFRDNQINAEFHDPDDKRVNYLAWVVDNPAYEKMKDKRFNLAKFRENYPAFAMLFPESEKEPTVYNLMCDFAVLMGEVIDSDFPLYKPMREQAIRETGMAGKLTGSIDPLSILWPMLAETATGRRIIEATHIMMNDGNKDREGIIFALFMHLDFTGFMKDKITANHGYMNLTADATHCFYSSYCDLFVTNDERTAGKSAAVYQYLGFGTQVLSMTELGTWVQNQKSF